MAVQMMEITPEFEAQARKLLGAKMRAEKLHTAWRMQSWPKIGDSRYIEYMSVLSEANKLQEQVEQINPHAWQGHGVPAWLAMDELGYAVVMHEPPFIETIYVDDYDDDELPF